MIGVRLVPRTAPKDLRALIKPEEYEALRSDLMEKRSFTCLYCASRVREKGPRRIMEEWFHYEATRIRELYRVVLCCERCYLLTTLDSSISINDALTWIGVVNGWEAGRVIRHIRRAIRLYEERSRISWRENDFGWLDREGYIGKR